MEILHASRKLLIILLLLQLNNELIESRKVTECELAKELIKNKADKTFISHLVCAVKYEANFNTKKVKRGRGASMSYGIFQINSERWCSVGRKGGVCNANCKDFIDDNIQDDIKCGLKIFENAGLQYWTEWVKNCKSAKALPNLNNCLGVRKRNLLFHVQDNDNFLKFLFSELNSYNSTKNS